MNIPKSFRVTALPKKRGTLSEAFEVRVEDDGVDITHTVRSLIVCRDMRRTYAEVELINREGFDGPFCTPVRPL